MTDRSGISPFDLTEAQQVVNFLLQCEQEGFIKYMKPEDKTLLIPIPEELKHICKEIISSGKTNEEWAEVESDDWFQTETIVGGYDATEKAFCFSYYDSQGEEYYFQFTFDEVNKILSGKKLELELRKA